MEKDCRDKYILRRMTDLSEQINELSQEHTLLEEEKFSILQEKSLEYFGLAHGDLIDINARIEGTLRKQFTNSYFKKMMKQKSNIRIYLQGIDNEYRYLPNGESRSPDDPKLRCTAIVKLAQTDGTEEMGGSLYGLLIGEIARRNRVEFPDEAIAESDDTVF